eukprot:TRINITY_DN12648_c0_g1_i1.p1 TRINITY_DN12648_c0_g1~~TRINITY_DN12648_c0_g1_i1.p1  ORF type:complete len:240 (+),score=41.16 TRINITY_DN12648_c0_g1_i1:64-783(+)
MAQVDPGLLELRYFDFPGKGQSIRLACALGGLSLKDSRLSREEFLDLKQQGELPFGQLPVLDLPNGERLAQTGAILRLIGRWTGLYPSDPLDACKVDMLLELETDLMLPVLLTVQDPTRHGLPPDLPWGADGDVVAARRSSLLSEGDPNEGKSDGPLRRRLLQLEASLRRFGFGPDESDPWAAGTARPTIADCALVPRLRYLSSGELSGIPTDVLLSYPMVNSLVERFGRLPAVQDLKS